MNLETLMTGTDKPERINQNIYNRFYGSLEPLRNMSKLSGLCIEATDIDSGLEYLSDSLGIVNTDPRRSNAKVAQIREQLRSYNYNVKSWQLAHSELMDKARKEKHTDKNQLVIELETQIQKVEKELTETKQNNSDKTKKITRLESELRILKATHAKLKAELDQEKNNHQHTKDTHQLQLADLATIIFPSSSVNNNLGFADIREQAKKNKTKLQDLKTALSEEQKANQLLTKTISQLRQELAQVKEELKEKSELTMAKQLVITETG